MQDSTMRKNGDKFKFILQTPEINELFTWEFSFIDNSTKNQLKNQQVLSSRISLYSCTIYFGTVNVTLLNLTKSD